MPKDDLIYIGHMYDMVQKALEKISGKKRPEYDNDEILKMALAHVIQIIGEAARQVSSEFRESNPQIPWRAIIGTRHKIVHDYMHVDFDIVWDVVTNDLVPLAEELKKFFPTKES